MARRNRKREGTETRRQFTFDFKFEAVRSFESGEKSLAEVARELGIRPAVLRQWQHQVKARAEGLEVPQQSFQPAEKRSSQDEEIRQLRRENAQLREERDILGKAMAFFARTTR